MGSRVPGNDITIRNTGNRNGTRAPWKEASNQVPWDEVPTRVLGNETSHVV